MTTRVFDRIERLAHPTELGPESEGALAHSVRIAASSGAELDILHVDREAPQIDASEMPDARALLEKWGQSGDGVEVQAIAEFGRTPVGPVLEHLEERPADLIVLATRRRDGLDRWLHREVAGKIARRAPAATLFVPFDLDGFVSPSTGVCSLRRVLVPVDWAPRPQVAVDAVVMLAEGLGLESLDGTLLHVGGGGLDFPVLDLSEASRCRWSRRVEEGGDVVETILRIARELEVDLVAMPTYGHDGFLDALRGSTTEQVLRGAPCPLLSVPALEG